MRPKTVQDIFEPIVRGVAQSGVRVANERAVLTLIAGLPGVSNADIARRSGLGPQTTARILADLEARNLIVRGEVLRGRRGQPATPYRLNGDGAYGIGIEIGWNHIELLLQNIAGEQIAIVRRAHALSRGPQACLDLLLEEIGPLLENLDAPQRERLLGIGLAMPTLSPALLDTVGADPDSFPLWSSFDMAARLSQRAGLPVIGFDSGSAAAWCELLSLPLPRTGGLASFFIDTFIGGGVIDSLSLLEGAQGQAGHLGSVLVAGPDGRPTPLHFLASLTALCIILSDAGHQVPSGSPRHWPWDDFESETRTWVAQAARALAQAILSTSAIVDIDVAVINGDLPPFILDRLFERLAFELATFPPVEQRLPRLALGQGGPSAPVLGAARLLLYRSHFSRAWSLFEGDLGK